MDELPPGDEASLLNNVPRLLGVPEHHRGQFVTRLDQGPNQRVECTFVAAGSGRDQLSLRPAYVGGHDL
jgi:hypothetical protein